jgi:hypothetical protein
MDGGADAEIVDSAVGGIGDDCRNRPGPENGRVVRWRCVDLQVVISARFGVLSPRAGGVLESSFARAERSGSRRGARGNLSSSGRRGLGDRCRRSSVRSELMTRHIQRYRPTPHQYTLASEQNLRSRVLPSLGVSSLDLKGLGPALGPPFFDCHSILRVQSRMTLRRGNNSNEITPGLDAISTHEPSPPGPPGRGDRLEPLSQAVEGGDRPVGSRALRQSRRRAAGRGQLSRLHKQRSPVTNP